MSRASMKFFILTNVYGQNDRFHCDAATRRWRKGEKGRRGEGVDLGRIGASAIL